jgi:hypothetical protein
LDGEGKQGATPQLWDGKAAERIVNILDEKENRHAYIDAAG